MPTEEEIKPLTECPNQMTTRWAGQEDLCLIITHVFLDDKLAIRLGEVSDRVASIARRELRSTTSCAQARLWLEIIWWELADLARWSHRTVRQVLGRVSPGHSAHSLKAHQQVTSTRITSCVRLVVSWRACTGRALPRDLPGSAGRSGVRWTSSTTSNFLH